MTRPEAQAVTEMPDLNIHSPATGRRLSFAWGVDGNPDNVKDKGTTLFRLKGRSLKTRFRLHSEAGLLVFACSGPRRTKNYL